MRKMGIVSAAMALAVATLTAAVAQTGARQKSYPGVYRAAVIDVSDPSGQHRVRIRMPAVSGTAAKWALIATSAPDGVQSVPEVGDEVVVAFEHGDPDQPVILGRIYNPKS